MVFAAGTRFGAYEVTDLLAAGGMGEVYRAYDKRLGRSVAVKVLGESLIQNPVAVRRFEQEARAASALSHPHILHIYDIGSSKVAGRMIRYIVMELIEGNTLAEHIHSRRSELPKLLGWMVQVCDALAKAHSAGIIHRDLKPDNIMIATDGYAKILDFGLAKLFEQDSPASEDATAARGTPLSMPGILVGTAGYMSPEQAQAGRTDFRTDIFAIGAILYECATRAAAFRGASWIDTLHQVVHNDPNLGALPAGLTPIVRKALAKNPVERHESARTLAADLQIAIRSGLTEERSTSRSPTAHEYTLAVLPFDDISPDHDNEYFSDGLTEEIISDLSKIRSLRVTSRASVMKFTGAEKDLDAVAQQLGVDYVIDGSVRKAGAQLRITAELVDTKTKAQLWSEKYHGTLNDVFEIQESVARSIAQHLQIQLTSAESAQLAERPISDVRAYECLLRARRDILRFNEQGLRSALREIKQGLSLSPNNVPLLAARGYAHWQYYNAGIIPDPEHLERAEEDVRRIFELAPDSPHGHRLLGLIYIQKSRVREAERHLRRAVEDDPTDTDSLLWLAGTSVVIGKLDEALRLSERLVAIDPLTAPSHLFRGAILQYTGDVVGGLAHFQRAQEIHKYSIQTIYYVQCLALLRRFDEARHHSRVFLAAHPDNPIAKMTMALVHAIDGDMEQAHVLLDERVRQVARVHFQYCSWIGEIYALLGEKDEALDWLEYSIRRGYTPWVYFTRVDWFLDNLRGDSRFEALMELARKECEAPPPA